jgi:aspartate/methionine/tyrosine aminotransferase
LNSNGISDDAKNRARTYIKMLGTPVGAYTGNSKGFDYAREQIAKFINKRDGVEADSKNIYLTNGASEGVRTSFNMLIRNEKDGVMIPIP